MMQETARLHPKKTRHQSNSKTTKQLADSDVLHKSTIINNSQMAKSVTYLAGSR